jgi:prenyltransferase beta subunit
MRYLFAFLLLVPSVAVAQPNDTAKWVLAREAPTGGFALTAKDTKPGLRSTSGAVRALRYLGEQVPNKDKHAAFVLSCYDPKTGGFAEPGGKPDVTITAVGVMAAAELGIPKEKYAKAMDYLKANAKTFEDVRIGAAAVEAWGVKDCPFKLDAWADVARKQLDEGFGDPADGGARELGSVAAMLLRLERAEVREQEKMLTARLVRAGQRADGGWGKKGEKDSDIETTYRVMRAFYLLKETPKDVAKVREFVAKHRNADGGYATKPGDASGMSGAYYAAIVSSWAK